MVTTLFGRETLERLYLKVIRALVGRCYGIQKNVPVVGVSFLNLLQDNEKISRSGSDRLYALVILNFKNMKGELHESTYGFFIKV